ncbi:hypothetical protein HYT04_02765 [Candidatus Kaiserbacteria bacterium]|nr:hypothetical protein [Candidatus Kaiserbacteria bacterium]
MPKAPLLDDIKKVLREYDVEGDFLLDIDKPWGFGGVLEPYRRASRDDGHTLIEYAITIPRIEKDVGVCKDCNGTREVDGMECLHCMRTGRETSHEWDVIDRIGATLHVLGIILDKPGKEMLIGIDTKRKQLLSLRTYLGRGNAFIGATLSRSFGDYIRKLSEQHLPEVKAATKSAYQHMFPRRRQFGDYDFRADVHRNGQLIIDVPGDACGLYVDGMSKSLHEVSGPVELDCHNVDGHHQQLTLLCGLATLTSMARMDLYSRRIK